jgi:hypothetical protein
MAHLARAIVKILIKFNSYTSMAADINFYGLVCGQIIRKNLRTFSKVSICFHSFATLLILLILSGADRQKTRIQTKRKSGGRCGEETPFLPPQMEYLSLL